LTYYVEIDLLIEEIDSDRVIEADSLVDLLIKEINSHRLVFVTDSLVNLLIKKINSDHVIEADSLVDTETQDRLIH